MDSSNKYEIPKELSRTKVWGNHIFNVEECTLQAPTGEEYSRVVMTHPGAVTILPFVSSDEIIMLKQYRHPAKQYLWEIPAGLIEKNEEPIETAKRELIEETGFKADSMKLFSHWYSAPGFAEEQLYLYLAWDLTFVGQNLDETEVYELHVERMKLERAYELADKGEIVDSKTLIALYKYRSLPEKERI